MARAKVSKGRRPGKTSAAKAKALEGLVLAALALATRYRTDAAARWEPHSEYFRHPDTGLLVENEAMVPVILLNRIDRAASVFTSLYRDAVKA